MTITTLDLALQKVLEPYASEPQERLNTLKKAREKGAQFTDTPANLKVLFRVLQGLDLDRVLGDRLISHLGVLGIFQKGLK